MKIQPTNSIYIMPKYNASKKEEGSNILTENNGVITALGENDLGINVGKVLLNKLRDEKYSVDITV